MPAALRFLSQFTQYGTSFHDLFFTGTWAEHGQTTGGFYKCNRFMPAEVKSIISAIDKAKAELDRYI